MSSVQGTKFFTAYFYAMRARVRAKGQTREGEMHEIRLFIWSLLISLALKWLRYWMHLNVDTFKWRGLDSPPTPQSIQLLQIINTSDEKVSDILSIHWCAFSFSLSPDSFNIGQPLGLILRTTTVLSPFLQRFVLFLSLPDFMALYCVVLHPTFVGHCDIRSVIFLLHILLLSPSLPIRCTIIVLAILSRLDVFRGSS